MSTTRTTRLRPAPARRGLGLAARALHFVALGATLLAALLLALALLPNAWGWSSMVVTSGSMEPTLSPGDVVLVQPRKDTSYEPMDIATYIAEDGQRVTHRIIRKGSDPQSTSYVFRGDANEDADPAAVDSRNVLGQVRYAVPKVGYLIAWARTPLGLALLALALAYVAFGGGGRRRGAADEAPDHDVESSDELPALVGS